MYCSASINSIQFLVDNLLRTFLQNYGFPFIAVAYARLVHGGT